MKADESSKYISTLSYSLSKPQPQNSNPLDYIGSIVSLITNCGLRYEGVFYHLNLNDKTIWLLNVLCYGTEDRKEFQILPSNQIYSYIVFNTSQIKSALVKPPRSYGYGCLARGGAISSKLSRSTKPHLPYIFSSYSQHGAKIRQEVHNTTEATTDDYNASSDGLQIAWNNPLYLPQYPGLDYYDPWLNHVYQSMPCDVLYQDPTNATLTSISSEQVFAPQSFFTTFPPVPISLRPANGRLDFETLTKNFKPYELWGPQVDNKQGDQTADTVNGSSYQNETCNSQVNNNQKDQTACTIDGSFYTISRKPFDPIGRPYNPFGPIRRPWPHLPPSHELADLGFV